MRRTAVVLAALAGLFGVGASLLVWRLASGPISVNLLTPWLESAIQENFGARHSVKVGDTVIERDENGRTALRTRDIVVRDADGTVVASAPRAEVGISVSGLLSGHLHAESLNLVGAGLAVRIEPDGQVTVFAGADKRPIATAPAVAAQAIAPVARQSNDKSAPSAQDGLAALLSWIDSLSALGLDGYDLTEIGLKSGNLTVDDRRNGKQSSFQNVNLSLTRPHAGEVVFSVGSDSADRRWTLLAGVKPIGQGRRAIAVDASRMFLRDILLCLRQGDDQLEAELPVSASLRGELDPNGMLDVANGRIIVGPGIVGDAADPLSRIPIDRAEFNLDWDATRHTLVVPFQLVSGGNRFTLAFQAEAPRDPAGNWAMSLTGGSVVVAPVGNPDEPTLLLNRVLIQAHVDRAKRRFEFDKVDIGGKDVGLAGSGNVDFSTPDPKVSIAVYSQNLTYASFKQLWPSFINPPVRTWVLEHFFAGTVERIDVATNAPLSTLRAGGPPLPDDGMAVEVVTKGVTVQPLVELPPIKDADLTTRIVGRAVTVNLGKGTAEVSPGHKLTLSNGVFEVPDSQAHPPQARVRMRIEGPVPVAAELLASERLRESSGAPLDPASSRGTVIAQAGLAFPIDLNLPKGSSSYAITADVANFATNFVVDKSMAPQRVEAPALRIVANNQGYQVKGDVRIGGTPASVEFHKPRGDEDTEIRMQAVFDDAARARMGVDLNGVSGPIPVKFSGRIAASPERENRYVVETDLTQAKVDNLLPGWVKPAGKATRANFNLIAKGKANRIEDLVIDGGGVGVKGNIDIDANGDVQSANFPAFGFSDTDKATLKVERTPEGALKAVLRGDVFDGRSFVKTILSGGAAGEQQQQKSRASDNDLDLEVKVGAFLGSNGEAVRGLDLRYSRRGGHVRNFSLNGKLGDTALLGEMRRDSNGHQVIFFETKDAGALFRFTNTYAYMRGGEMWAAMDPPTADQAPQEGRLHIQDFAARGDPQLDRVIATMPGSPHGSVGFDQLRVEFSRAPGKLTIREGAVNGPVIGATIEGQIDYPANAVQLRGTIVPLYSINHLLSGIPVVNIFLTTEGLFALPYQVVGPPGNPMLNANMAGMLAPGLLRKVFDYPKAGGERLPAPDISR